MSDDLVILLSSLLAGERSIPLSIALRDDNEVTTLRNEIKALQAKYDALKADYDRAEYLYKCESLLNNRLVDLCRVSGIQLGPDFFIRPDESVKKKSL